jgi:hypothetical protein
MAESALNRSSRNSNREYGRPASMPHLTGKALNRALPTRGKVWIVLGSALDATIVNTLMFVPTPPSDSSATVRRGRLYAETRGLKEGSYDAGNCPEESSGSG